MTKQHNLEQLEKVILGEPEAFAFPTNNEERIAAVHELEYHGLHGLGVIGNYWMLKGHFDIHESSSEMENVLNEVWKNIQGKYDEIKTNEEFVRKVAEETIGYLPEDEKVLPVVEYQKIYSTVHAVVLPAMLMGRIDSFGEGKEQTLKRLLSGMQRLEQMFSKSK